MRQNWEVKESYNQANDIDIRVALPSVLKRSI